MLKKRTKQKIYLARYGRQSWSEWEHRDVTEIDEAFDALNELVGEENDLVSKSEDR